jgi:hypothetical protein
MKGWGPPLDVGQGTFTVLGDNHSTLDASKRSNDSPTTSWKSYRVDPGIVRHFYSIDDFCRTQNLTVILTSGSSLFCSPCITIPWNSRTKIIYCSIRKSRERVSERERDREREKCQINDKSCNNARPPKNLTNLFKAIFTDYTQVSEKS